ncbi:MAG: hypothetical protein O2819_09485 [Planctomycetota bacterium]|nr:hypothetical protein [Planctomycetota bacterium]MDA1106701.1 hypothetical protein [Planctomycetota bacterium]
MCGRFLWGIADVRAAEVANVRYQIKQLREKSEILSKAEAAGEIQMKGAPNYGVCSCAPWC